MKSLPTSGWWAWQPNGIAVGATKVGSVAFIYSSCSRAYVAPGGGKLRESRTMRVLVVEDYEPLREALAEGLREAEFAVDLAGDGDMGLWYATSNDYDVI